MNINDKQQKLIERYLDNILSSAQQKAFDIELENEAFRKQLMFQARIIDAHRSNEHEKLLKKLDSFAQAEKKAPKNRRNLGLLLGIIALSLLSYLLLFSAKPDKSHEELYAQYFIDLPANVDQRGEVKIVDEAYKVAMQSYIEKKYELAASQFQVLKGQTENSNLYLGICYLKLYKLDQADQTFARILNTSNGQIKDNAEWYYILIKLKTNDISTVKEKLKPITMNEDHLFYKKAQDLIKDLEGF